MSAAYLGGFYFERLLEVCMLVQMEEAICNESFIVVACTQLQSLSPISMGIRDHLPALQILSQEYHFRQIVLNKAFLHHCRVVPVKLVPLSEEVFEHHVPVKFANLYNLSSQLNLVVCVLSE